jgi:RimJ/RimL family protein N-acetyltransferase
MKVVLETSRLRLREMTHGDIDFVAAMLADPEVMRYYPRCYSREESEAWVERQLERYARFGHGLWLVLDRMSAAPVGQVGLVMQTVDGVEEPEVGYLIDRPFWRRGLATEAACAVRDYAFTILARPHVISLVRTVNMPSQCVARKLGMVPVRRTLFRDLEHLVFQVWRA